jgi:hypothetical protein
MFRPDLFGGYLEFCLAPPPVDEYHGMLHLGPIDGRHGTLIDPNSEISLVGLNYLASRLYKGCEPLCDLAARCFDHDTCFLKQLTDSRLLKCLPFGKAASRRSPEGLPDKGALFMLEAKRDRLNQESTIGRTVLEAHRPLKPQETIRQARAASNTHRLQQSKAHVSEELAQTEPDGAT